MKLRLTLTGSEQESRIIERKSLQFLFALIIFPCKFIKVLIKLHGDMINEQLFFALNPWQVGDWIVDKHLIPRSLQSKLADQINNPYIQILIGARRTGKTTLMQQCIDHRLQQQTIPAKNIFYLNFDDIELRTELKNNPHLLIEMIELFSGKSIAENPSSIFLFLDEVQKYPQYFDQIKLYYDTYRSKLQFILSGSAALEIGSRTAETFAGRSQHNYLFPLSLKEIVSHNFSGIELPSLLCQLLNNQFQPNNFREIYSHLLPITHKLTSLLQKILISGLLPEPFLAKDELEAFDYLRQYRLTYLERDIRSLTQVGNLEDFSRLLNLIILQIGNLLVKSRFASDVGIAQNTVAKYLSISEQTFVLERVQPYTAHIRKRLVRSPKLCFFDVGFFSLASGLKSYEVLKTGGKLGVVFENLCFNEIQKTISTAIPSSNILFWRTAGGAEVDFVIENNDHLIPIEVKSSSSYGHSDLKNLLRFKQDYPTKVSKMVFIYNGPMKMDGDIIFVPIWLV